MTATLRSTDPVLAAFAGEVGDSGPVAIEGNRTRWDIGGKLDEGTRLLRAPTGIVGYVPEEMIVTVRAGTTVSELHDVLAEHGQWTSLPERGGTVGGAIAVGQNGYHRPARGDVRASVLQVRYVSADGKLVTGGGPTVKNVSGFDLPRLLTGSLGTLGCIAEVILRTNPVPSVQRWFQSFDVDPFALRSALLAPGPILWDGECTSVMLYGHEVAVNADSERIRALGTFAECADPGVPMGERWSLAPADLTRLTDLDTGAFVAEIGIGTVHAEKPQPVAALAASVRLVHERVKAGFDPNNRLNPGRVVGAR